MAARVIAIDIDDTSIRLLQVRRNRVERWASAAVAAGPASDGARPDPAELGAQLRQLMRSSGIGGGTVVTSLSGLYSVSRVLTLPPQPRRETEQALPGLVQEALGAKGLTLRWQVVSADETGQRVLALGVPSRIVEGYTAILRAAGLQPLASELRALALTRAVDQERALIVNAEHSNLDLVVETSGIPHIMRTVPLTAGLGAEERAEQLVWALERTVAFYNSQNPLAQLPPDTPLFLVGSLAEDPALREKVAHAVAYPLATFEPGLEFPPHLPRRQHAVTIGLALSQLPRRSRSGRGTHPLQMNFLPKTVARWRITPQRALLVASVVAGLAVANLLYTPVSHANQTAGELKREIFRLEQQVKLRQAELSRITQLEAAIRDLKALTAPGGRVIEMRALVEKALPPGVELTNLTVEPNEIRLAARAGSVEQAIAFVEALRATGRFTEVPYPRASTDISATLRLAPPKSK